MVAQINSSPMDRWSIITRLLLGIYSLLVVAGYSASMDNLLGIDLLTIVYWLAFGLIVGVIVHLIDPGSARGGVMGTILFGLVGALVGGIVAPLLFGENLSVTGLNLTSIAVAVVGALVLIMIQRLLFRDSAHIRTTIGQEKPSRDAGSGHG